MCQMVNQMFYAVNIFSIIKHICHEFALFYSATHANVSQLMHNSSRIANNLYALLYVQDNYTLMYKYNIHTHQNTKSIKG